MSHNNSINKQSLFFLGSGFSKAIVPNYPLLKDLSQDLLGVDFEKINDYDQKKFFPNSSVNDFEELLTYLATDFPWKDSSQKLLHTVIYNEITKKLVNYFYDKNVDTGTQRSEFKKLWQYIMYYGTPVITLNYDLIVENNLLLNKTINPRRNIVIGNSETYESFYRGKIADIKQSLMSIFSVSDEIPEILKLHGSINWFCPGDTKNSQIYCGYNETETEKALIENYTPFIVPPVLDKTNFYGNKILEYIWQKAFKYISKAKKIYIIGFSFPKTDLSVKYLFESALKINKNNYEIFIVNTNESKDFENRCKTVLGEEKCNFEYCKPNCLLDFVNNELDIPSPNNKEVNDEANCK